MATSVINRETTDVESFVIQPNTKFDLLPLKSITLLENTANAVSYEQIDINVQGSTQMTFQRNIGSDLFLDRGVRLSVTIPIKISHAYTPSVSAEPPLLTMKNFDDIAYRQYGFLNCIETLQLNLNNNPISMVSDVARSFEMCAEYYGNDEVDKWFPCSQPDRFPAYKYYNSAGTTTSLLDTFDEKSTACQFPVPKMSEENPFSGGFSTRYNSRKPIVSNISTGTTTWPVTAGPHDLFATVTTYCYIPFTLFGLSSSDISLYGINQFQLTVTLKPNYVKHLFVKKGVEVLNFDYNNANTQLNTASLHLKTYDAPEYIRNVIRDPATGFTKPYRLGASKLLIVDNKTKTYTGLTRANQSEYVQQFTLSSIPKSFYIGVFPQRSLTDPFNTPGVKARIKHVQINIGAIQTSIGSQSDAITMYDLCKANGLNKDYESAMYSAGYVVKLDSAKDLGFGGALVGMAANVNVHMKITFDILDREPDTPGGTAPMVQNFEVRVAHNSPTQVIHENGQFKEYASLVFSSMDITIQNQQIGYQDQFGRRISIIGGGFWGDVWSGVKKLAKNGFEYVKNNPEEALGYLRKGIKLATGAGHQPYSQNIIGGSTQTQLLGAGKMSNDIFKHKP